MNRTISDSNNYRCECGHGKNTRWIKDHVIKHIEICMYDKKLSFIDYTESVTLEYSDRKIIYKCSKGHVITDNWNNFLTRYSNDETPCFSCRNTEKFRTKKCLSKVHKDHINKLLMNESVSMMKFEIILNNFLASVETNDNVNAISIIKSLWREKVENRSILEKEIDNM